MKRSGFAVVAVTGMVAALAQVAGGTASAAPPTGQSPQMRAAILAKPMDALVSDKALAPHIADLGARAFQELCAGCHGPGGASVIPGFPILNDKDWLFGGLPDQILNSVEHGARLPDGDRVVLMPRFAAEGLLEPARIEQVVDYVMALSAGKGAKVADTPGAAVFRENCASCHGEGGDGDITLGAPRLNDAVWLYGGRREDVLRSVSNLPPPEPMPAWGKWIDPALVKILAAYVHKLGGGELPAPAKPGAAKPADAKPAASKP